MEQVILILAPLRLIWLKWPATKAADWNVSSLGVDVGGRVVMSNSNGLPPYTPTATNCQCRQAGGKRTRGPLCGDCGNQPGLQTHSNPSEKSSKILRKGEGSQGGWGEPL